MSERLTKRQRLAAIADLVIEQTEDDASDHADSDPARVLNFTDAGFDEPERRIIDERDSSQWIYLIGQAGLWRGSDEPTIKAACPVCHKARLSSDTYCVRCDRCGDEPRAMRHGKPAIAPTRDGWWGKATPTKLEAQELKGGR